MRRVKEALASVIGVPAWCDDVVPGTASGHGRHPLELSARLADARGFSDVSLVMLAS